MRVDLKSSEVRRETERVNCIVNILVIENHYTRLHTFSREKTDIDSFPYLDFKRSRLTYNENLRRSCETLEGKY